MKLRFFDFEVYPHWWCCSFGDYNNNINEDIKNDFIVITSDDENARDKFMNIVREKDICLVGHNIKHYDLMIANGIYQGFDPEHIRMINDIIINPSNQFKSREHQRMAPFANRKLSGICYYDQMDDNDPSSSLKDKEAILGLDIRETEVPFDKEELTNEDKANIIFYNKHDVYASIVYYHKICGPLYKDTALALCRTFNIPEDVGYKSTNAKLVSLALKAKRANFSDEEKIQIEIPPRIREYVYQNVPSKILEQIVNSAESFKVELFENEVSYGNGGIHSVPLENKGRKSTEQVAVYFESNEDWVLVNVDASSYYPSILIKLNCLSRCVENPKDFENIFNRRIELKLKENRTLEEEIIQKALKLILNTTFGASGNKYLELYDPHQCTKTCRVGQLFLTAFACRLYRAINGLKVVQTNTDGILIYLHRKDLPLLRKFEQEWTDISGILMEEDIVSKIWQRDVNNYLLIKENGKIKKKGGWLNDTMMNTAAPLKLKPLSAFASAKAAAQYLIDGTDIMENIVSNKNLIDFVMTCKKGPTYSKVVQKYANGFEEDLFKCNRVIASKNKQLGKIYKLKNVTDKDGNKRVSYTQMADIPDCCLTVNADLSTYDFKILRKEIDYSYYIVRAADLLDMVWKEYKDGKYNLTDRFLYQI